MYEYDDTLMKKFKRRIRHAFFRGHNNARTTGLVLALGITVGFTGYIMYQAREDLQAKPKDYITNHQLEPGAFYCGTEKLAYWQNYTFTMKPFVHCVNADTNGNRMYESILLSYTSYGKLTMKKMTLEGDVIHYDDFDDFEILPDRLYDPEAPEIFPDDILWCGPKGGKLRGMLDSDFNCFNPKDEKGNYLIPKVIIKGNEFDLEFFRWEK
ncbi:hypothetical protein ACFL1H_08315 [Nanoarchaeota archaeon]